MWIWLKIFVLLCLILGRQGPVQGNTEALATVTGIVDGTGSFGAAIGQVSNHGNSYFIPRFSQLLLYNISRSIPTMGSLIHLLYLYILWQ